MGRSVGLAVLLTLITQCQIQNTHYEANIERIFSDAFEETLIAQAEAVYPSREDVLAVAQLNDIPDGDLWYYAEAPYDQLLPYAITAECIAYYEQYMADLEARYGDDEPHWRPQARVDYRAEVAFHDTFEIEGMENTAVYVVDMDLSVGYSCGSLCGGGFSKARTVVFDSDGLILAVYGDGLADRWLS